MDSTQILELVADRLINAEALIWGAQLAVQREQEEHSEKNIDRLMAFLEMLVALAERTIQDVAVYDGSLDEKKLIKKEVSNG